MPWCRPRLERAGVVIGEMVGLGVPRARGVCVRTSVAAFWVHQIGEGLTAGGEDFQNPVDIVDRAAPGAAADFLHRGPQAPVGGQGWIGGQIGAQWARGEQARAGLSAEDVIADPRADPTTDPTTDPSAA